MGNGIAWKAKDPQSELESIAPLLEYFKKSSVTDVLSSIFSIIDLNGMAKELLFLMLKFGA
jgi:hypothetical protein